MVSSDTKQYNKLKTPAATLSSSSSHRRGGGDEVSAGSGCRPSPRAGIPGREEGRAASVPQGLFPAGGA